MKNHTRKCVMAAIGSLLIASSALGGTRSGLTRLSDGIIIDIPAASSDDTRRVRLRVVSDKIIHVSATPDSLFADLPSLVTVEKRISPRFKVPTTDSSAIVSTTGPNAEESL